MPYVNSISPMKYGRCRVYIDLNQEQNLGTYIDYPFDTESRHLIFHNYLHYLSIDYAHAYKKFSKHQLDPKNECILNMQEEVINIIYKHSKKKESKVKPFFRKCFDKLTNF